MAERTLRFMPTGVLGYCSLNAVELVMQELRNILEDRQREAAEVLAKSDCFCLYVRLRTWERKECNCDACEAEALYQFCARELKRLAQI